MSSRDPLTQAAAAAPVDRPMDDVSDADLDTMILARLRLLGVDLSVLPEDDADAPVDQRRVMEGARRFLRTTPAAISGFAMDPQEVVPLMVPGNGAGPLGVDAPRGVDVGLGDGGSGNAGLGNAGLGNEGLGNGRSRGDR